MGLDTSVENQQKYIEDIYRELTPDEYEKVDFYVRHPKKEKVKKNPRRGKGRKQIPKKRPAPIVPTVEQTPIQRNPLATSRIVGIETVQPVFTAGSIAETKKEKEEPMDSFLYELE